MRGALYIFYYYYYYYYDDALYYQIDFIILLLLLFSFICYPIFPSRDGMPIDFYFCLAVMVFMLFIVHDFSAESRRPLRPSANGSSICPLWGGLPTRMSPTRGRGSTQTISKNLNQREIPRPQSVHGSKKESPK